MFKATIYYQIPQVIQESTISYKRGKCLQSPVVLLQDWSLSNSPHSEHTLVLNILAKEHLKHAAYLLQGTLLIDSGRCCGAAFGEWHKTANLITFGWVCVGATEPVNIPTSPSPLGSLLTGFQLRCVSLRLLLGHVRHRPRWNQVHLNFSV